MILIVSTSSSAASIAWVKEGQILHEASREAARSSSQAVIEMVNESGFDLNQASGFVSDLGPGSLTGVKVGVTLVKTWGFALGLKVAGMSAFELVSLDEPVVISPRRGEFFVRLPHKEPCVMTAEELASAGLSYGPQQKAAPLASRGAALVEGLSWMEPEILVPLYLSAPLVSIAKKPLTLLEPRNS